MSGFFVLIVLNYYWYRNMSGLVYCEPPAPAIVPLHREICNLVFLLTPAPTERHTAVFMWRGTGFGQTILYAGSAYTLLNSFTEQANFFSIPLLKLSKEIGNFRTAFPSQSALQTVLFPVNLLYYILPFQPDLLLDFSTIVLIIPLMVRCHFFIHKECLLCDWTRRCQKPITES